MRGLCFLVVTGFFILSSCVAVLNVPPRDEIQGGDVRGGNCTDGYGAVVVDVVIGTVLLGGGVTGAATAVFAASQGGRESEFVTSLGVMGASIGIAGALLHYFSAASNDVSECRREKKQGAEHHASDAPL